MPLSIDDLIAQRDAVLKNFGISKSEYQGRSIEYTSGPNRIVELTRLEQEIEKRTNQQAGTTGSRCTYGSFRRG